MLMKKIRENSKKEKRLIIHLCAITEHERVDKVKHSPLIFLFDFFLRRGEGFQTHVIAPHHYQPIE